MDSITLIFLFIVLFFLLLFSAFFSGSETALMSLNRYRLRHLVEQNHKGAICASQLLKRPDRLISLILIGNNFVNILASSIATLIAIKVLGDSGIAISTLILTLVVLIFAEVTPKTLAVLYPDRIAFFAARIYTPMLRIFSPLVGIINWITHHLLKPFGIFSDENISQALSREELRSVVLEAGSIVPQKHQTMLLGILDLYKITVDDIMIARNEVMGIDIHEDWGDIKNKMATSPFTRLPVYEDSINNIIGIAHLRMVLHALMNNPEFSHDDFKLMLNKAEFVLEGTALNQQLIQFQRNKKRVALVVNEYGEVSGLVTLEDILEEIVGEFTSDPVSDTRYVRKNEEDDSYLVDASINIRSLNRMMQWHLPIEGPKTLNGLILEYLEEIPENPVSFSLNNYTIEILKPEGNVIKTVKIFPPNSETLAEHT